MKSAARFVRSLDRSPATLARNVSGPFLADQLDLIQQNWLRMRTIGSCKDAQRLSGIGASGFAPVMVQNRPSLRVSDWRTPETEPALPDAPHRAAAVSITACLADRETELNTIRRGTL